MQKYVHPLCDTAEFAEVIRRKVTYVQAEVRSGKLEACGRPANINIDKASDYGVTLEQAHEILWHIRNRKGGEPE